MMNYFNKWHRMIVCKKERFDMPSDNLQRLGAFIRQRREALGISQRELARRASVADVSRLEQGLLASPRTNTLEAIAGALGLTLSELVSVGNASELPAFMPYMRAKYRDLSDAEIQEVETFVSTLRDRQQLQAPRDGEDER